MCESAEITAKSTGRSYARARGVRSGSYGREDLGRDPLKGGPRLARVGAQRGPGDDQLVQPQVDELAEAPRARLGRADDAEALDELGREGARLRRADLCVTGHVVRVVHRRERVALVGLGGATKPAAPHPETGGSRRTPPRPPPGGRHVPGGRRLYEPTHRPPP